MHSNRAENDKLLLEQAQLKKYYQQRGDEFSHKLDEMEARNKEATAEVEQKVMVGVITYRHSGQAAY